MVTTPLPVERPPAESLRENAELLTDRDLPLSWLRYAEEEVSRLRDGLAVLPRLLERFV